MMHFKSTGLPIVAAVLVAVFVTGCPEFVPTNNFTLDYCILNTNCRQHLCVAHRGGYLYAPENTRAAWELGLFNGADMIECDVRHTSDDQLVIMHDSDVDRTTDGTGPVDSMTLAEIRALNVPSTYPDVPDQQVPTFRELLEFARFKCLIYIDKKTDHNARVVEEIQQANALDYVFIYTPNIQHAREIRALEPRLAIMYALSPEEDIPAVMSEIHPEMVEVTLDMLDDAHLQAIRQYPTRISIDALGYEVLGLGFYQFLVDKGMDIIQSDNVSTAAWFLRSVDHRPIFPATAAAQTFEAELATWEQITGVPLSPKALQVSISQGGRMAIGW